MKSILESLKNQKKQNLPFVVYRKPNSKTIIGIFQNNDHVYFSEKLIEKAFVFSPFEKKSAVIFPLNESKITFDTYKQKSKKIVSKYKIKKLLSEKKQFIEFCENSKQFLIQNNFQKVVISRNEIVKKKGFKFKKTIEALFQNYPTAFCYCWFHPKIGLWLGATPEKLFEVENNILKTMSLAGTQVFKNTIESVWCEKEKTEQQIVTNYITTTLKTISENVVASLPETARAGNLIHLKSTIEATLKKNTSVVRIISKLHPTPAVCGFPKTETAKFILKNEGYNREFYSGFLGEINFNFNTQQKATDLYVNLRCMKINSIKKDKSAEICVYMGCGITTESIAEKEWEETVNKSKTIKNILK